MPSTNIRKGGAGLPWKSVKCCSTAITATGNSSGSSGDKEYAFYWKKSTSTVWTTKSAYGNAESVAYTFNTPGTYNIKISVKDSTGAIVAKEFTVTVNS